MQIVLRHFATSRESILYAFDAWLNQCAMSASTPDERNSVPSAVEIAQINAARSGDEDAFRQLLEHYQPTISKQMRRFSRDRVVVENLVHDVFVEAFMSLDSFKGKSPFQHWLRKLAVRVGYRHWKAEARDKKRLEKLREEHELVPKFSGPPADAVDAREQLHMMLAKLGPRDRLVLTLLYWDGHSVAEAAKLAGWTQAMVKVQAHRARKKLKKLLEESK
jgi:RNA polymerase sigma-70 factor (ECF subfamily)